MLLSKSFKSGSNLRFQFAPFEFNGTSVLVSIQIFLKAVVVFGGSFGTLHLHTCMMFVWEHDQVKNGYAMLCV